jgi:hypothetical protein
MRHQVSVICRHIPTRREGPVSNINVNLHVSGLFGVRLSTNWSGKCKNNKIFFSSSDAKMYTKYVISTNCLLSLQRLPDPQANILPESSTYYAINRACVCNLKWNKKNTAMLVTVHGMSWEIVPIENCAVGKTSDSSVDNPPPASPRDSIIGAPL